MRRQALVLMLAATMTGCMSMGGSAPWAQPTGDNPGNPGCPGIFGRTYGPPQLQCLQDPSGGGVPIQGIWKQPGNDHIAREMLKNSVDLRQLEIQDAQTLLAMNSAGVQGPAGAMPTISPRGVPLPPGLPPLGPMQQGPTQQGPMQLAGYPARPPSSGVMQAGYTTGQSPQPSNYWGYWNYPYGYNYPNGYNCNSYYGYPYYGYYGNAQGNWGDARGSNGEVIHAEIRDGQEGGVRHAQYSPPTSNTGTIGVFGGATGGPVSPGAYPGQIWPWGGGGGMQVGGGYPMPASAMQMGGFGGGMPGMPGMGGMGGGPSGGGCPPGGNFQRTQIRVIKPSGMKVYWWGKGPNGCEMWSKYPLETPGRYNFVQGAIYRLKLTNIEDRPLLELYPTLEVWAANAKSQDFLSHSSVPLSFTDEDFQQVERGNYLVKVIYLPDPAYQDQAGSGLEEILSTRLDPGLDPVKEAQKRGTVLLVIRMGNVEQELAHTPLLNAGSSAFGGMPGSAGCPPGGCPPGGCPPGGCPPGNPGMPGNPGCPPGGCPPGGGPQGSCPPGGCPPGGYGGYGGGGPAGPGYGPGAGGYGPGGFQVQMMPPSYSLGGSEGLPNFFNQRPMPQVPYMDWRFGPYANSPWVGQNGMQGSQQYPPGYRPGMQPCPPGVNPGMQCQPGMQQCPPGANPGMQCGPQGCPPWLNPGANPNMMYNPNPGGVPAELPPALGGAGAQLTPPGTPPRRFADSNAQNVKDEHPELPRPGVDDAGGDNGAAKDVPGPQETSSTSRSSPLPPKLGPASVPVGPPPPSFGPDPGPGAAPGAPQTSAAGGPPVPPPPIVPSLPMGAWPDAAPGSTLQPPPALPGTGVPPGMMLPPAATVSSTTPVELMPPSSVPGMPPSPSGSPPLGVPSLTPPPPPAPAPIGAPSTTIPSTGQATSFATQLSPTLGGTGAGVLLPAQPSLANVQPPASPPPAFPSVISVPGNMDGGAAPSFANPVPPAPRP